jgi:hypothetical protein
VSCALCGGWRAEQWKKNGVADPTHSSSPSVSSDGIPTPGLGHLCSRRGAPSPRAGELLSVHAQTKRLTASSAAARHGSSASDMDFA